MSNRTDVAVPLREYLEVRIDGLSQSVDRRFGADAEARRKAEDALNARLGTMNEWRNTVSDILSRAMSRDQGAQELGAMRDRMDQADQSLETRLAALEAFRANIEGRIAATAMFITLINLAMTIAVVIISRR